MLLGRLLCVLVVSFEIRDDPAASCDTVRFVKLAEDGLLLRSGGGSGLGCFLLGGGRDDKVVDVRSVHLDAASDAVDTHELFGRDERLLLLSADRGGLGQIFSLVRKRVCEARAETPLAAFALGGVGSSAVHGGLVVDGAAGRRERVRRTGGVVGEGYGGSGHSE